MKKFLALLLVAFMLVALAACGGNTNNTSSTTSAESSQSEDPSGDVSNPEDEGVQLPNSDTPNLSGLKYGEDYVSLYEQFGKDITVDDVKEDDEGVAYITVDGKDYELGLDFLSMATVYNAVTDEEYAFWWRLYIQRWNAILPEIPLYSNEYYDLYNSKIVIPETAHTNPFWGPANALIEWSSEKDDNSLILGNTTDLGGLFRFASFGKTSPGAADNDVATLVSGLETVTTSKEGGYVWNDTVVKSHEETENEDGSYTYTIEIYDDLKYSDGTAITAKDYLVRVLVFSTSAANTAAQRDHKAGMYYAGYKTFAAYKGQASEDATKEFSGIRLLDTYKFSVTVDKEYIPYYYAIGYAGFSPEYPALWLNNADIKDDGNGAYITDEFYASEEATAAHIAASAKNTDTTYPYSGPYVVTAYDDSTKTATLAINENFKGNYEGKKPSIAKIVYKKEVSETQMADFKAGGVDLIAGITGGDETDEAVNLADGSNGKYAYIHYSRAGYGKLGFRADYGPVQFVAVRQAIAYCMDRESFAKQFTGGYGGVVNGPYYADAWMNKVAIANGMELNAYATSVDSAIEVLEAGGWIYDKDGNPYTEGVRYKKIAAADINDNDKAFVSKDQAYKTVEVNGDYYMPLVLNWFGTKDNPFTTLLQGEQFAKSENLKNAGFYIQENIGEFYPMLDELTWGQYDSGFSGTPMYTCFNFATGFNSAVYDFSYQVTVDPGMYDDNSNWYIKDGADIYFLK